VDNVTQNAKRLRLLSMVRTDVPAPHADRTADPMLLASGDAEWYLENISCQYACPAMTDVARYIAHIASEDYDSAYEINLEDNIFPGLLGRVCARPCEPACRRGRVDKPIAICFLKRVASDNRKKHGPPARIPRTKSQRVAVIGAGCAGLACARDLAVQGYEVVVYEALSVAGGMFTAGIPAWRLPRDICKEEIDDYFESIGVDIRLNQRIGVDLPLQQLVDEYDAVYLGAGTQKPQAMRIPGEDLDGVFPGLKFMEQVNLGPLPRVGRRVAVIGGGFTAMDCSRSSLRMGAEKVYVIYRRSRNEMLVFDEEAREAEHEGIDFQFLVQPIGVVSNDGKTVSGLKCVRNRLGEPDASGRRRPIEIEGSEFILDVDMVIAATGQNADTSWIPSELGVKVTRDGRAIVDQDTWMTNRPGLFAGGDYTAGARNLISAIADGKKAAASIDQYLRGVVEQVSFRAKFDFVPHLESVSDYWQGVAEDIQTDQNGKAKNISPQDATLRVSKVPASVWSSEAMRRRLMVGDDYVALDRVEMPGLDLPARWDLNHEVELGFEKASAFDEAKRCLQCQLNIFLDGPNCILCNGCVDVCPTKVISMVSVDTVIAVDGDDRHPLLEQTKSWRASAAMVIDEDLCIRCGLCIYRCPTNCITMQHYEPDFKKVSSIPLQTIKVLQPIGQPR
jgi:NADPH-dependent glutamate synthase beta subunit-like oxidoreductase